MAKPNHKVLVLAAIIIAGAAIASYLKGGQETKETYTAPYTNLGFEELSQIEITKGAASATLKKEEDNTWGVAERSGYPLDDEKLRKLVYTIVDLKTVDRMTDDPGKYAQMGLGASPDGGIVKMLGAQDVELGTLLIGKRRNGGRGQYVRMDTDPTVYMIGSSISVEADPVKWLDTALLELKESDIQSIRVSHATTEDSFTLIKSSPEGSLELKGDETGTKEEAVKELGRALAKLRLEDVIEDGAPSMNKLEFSTKVFVEANGGLDYELNVSLGEDGCHVKISSKKDSELNEMARAKVFRLSKFSCDKLVVKKEGILKN